MDKDEPKKALDFEDDDGFAEGYGQIIRVTYACPTCHYSVMEYDAKCEHCGQILKW